MRQSANFPIAAVFMALAVSAWPAGAATGGQTPDTMTATVQQVNVQDSTVAVVYGTSLALRVVELAVAPHCHVLLRGGEAGLGAIRRGQVVRVRYRKDNDGALVAEAIEVVRGAEGEP